MHIDEMVTSYSIKKSHFPVRVCMYTELNSHDSRYLLNYITNGILYLLKFKLLVKSDEVR